HRFSPFTGNRLTGRRTWHPAGDAAVGLGKTMQMVTKTVKNIFCVQLLAPLRSLLPRRDGTHRKDRTGEHLSGASVRPRIAPGSFPLPPRISRQRDHLRLTSVVATHKSGSSVHRFGYPAGGMPPLPVSWTHRQAL